MSDAKIAGLESAKQGILETIRAAAAASTFANEEERRKKLVGLGADLNDRLGVLGQASAPGAKHEISALVGRLDDVERRGLAALLKTTGGLGNEYRAFLASEVAHARPQRHASASSQFTGQMVSAAADAALQKKSAILAAQASREAASAISAPTVVPPQTAAALRSDTMDTTLGQAGLVQRVDDLKQSCATQRQAIKAHEVRLREIKRQRQSVTAAMRGSFDGDIKRHEQEIAAEKKTLGELEGAARQVEKPTAALRAKLSATARHLGPRGAATKAVDAVLAGASVPGNGGAAIRAQGKACLTPERLEADLGRPLAGAVRELITSGRKPSAAELAKLAKAATPGAAGPSDNRPRELASPGDLQPLPNLPPGSKRGIGINDEWLKYLPASAQQAGQAYYKAKQSYYDDADQIQQQILSLLHSSMPIESIIMMIMMLLAKQNESKLKLKISEVEFSSSLSIAKSHGGDRQQLLNRIGEQAQGPLVLTNEEKDALVSGRIDGVAGLEQKLRDKFGANDRDMMLLKDAHYDDNCAKAFELFNSEVGSSAEVKAQELSIAMSSYKDMAEAVSNIISTLQKMMEGVIQKI